MQAKISNGLGSDYIVLTNKNEICSGVFCLFPSSDKLAFDAMQYYYNHIPDTDKDKKMLFNRLTQLSLEWKRAGNSKSWGEITEKGNE